MSRRPSLTDFSREGEWTPVLTFVTVGDLSVSYSIQVGKWAKIGRIIHLSFRILTSAFTHTTASGNCLITGFPFTSGDRTITGWIGPVAWTGITKTNYTDINVVVNENVSQGFLQAAGSGQSAATVMAADMPTSGTVELRGTVSYETDE